MVLDRLDLHVEGHEMNPAKMFAGFLFLFLLVLLLVVGLVEVMLVDGDSQRGDQRLSLIHI
eukprot:6277369-Prorocentrum_lima.AAC.1